MEQGQDLSQTKDMWTKELENVGELNTSIQNNDKGVASSGGQTSNARDIGFNQEAGSQKDFSNVKHSDKQRKRKRSTSQNSGSQTSQHKQTSSQNYTNVEKEFQGNQLTDIQEDSSSQKKKKRKNQFDQQQQPVSSNTQSKAEDQSDLVSGNQIDSGHNQKKRKKRKRDMETNNRQQPIDQLNSSEHKQQQETKNSRRNTSNTQSQTYGSTDRSGVSDRKKKKKRKDKQEVSTQQVLQPLEIKQELQVRLQQTQVGEKSRQESDSKKKNKKKSSSEQSSQQRSKEKQSHSQGVVGPSTNVDLDSMNFNSSVQQPSTGQTMHARDVWAETLEKMGIANPQKNVSSKDKRSFSGEASQVNTGQGQGQAQRQGQHQGQGKRQGQLNASQTTTSSIVWQTETNVRSPQVVARNGGTQDVVQSSDNINAAARNGTQQVVTNQNQASFNNTCNNKNGRDSQSQDVREDPGSAMRNFYQNNPQFLQQIVAEQNKTSQGGQPQEQQQSVDGQVSNFWLNPSVNDSNTVQKQNGGPNEGERKIVCDFVEPRKPRRGRVGRRGRRRYLYNEPDEKWWYSVKLGEYVKATQLPGSNPNDRSQRSEQNSMSPYEQYLVKQYANKVRKTKQQKQVAPRPQPPPSAQPDNQQQRQYEQEPVQDFQQSLGQSQAQQESNTDHLYDVADLPDLEEIPDEELLREFMDEESRGWARRDLLYKDDSKRDDLKYGEYSHHESQVVIASFRECLRSYGILECNWQKVFEKEHRQDKEFKYFWKDVASKLPHRNLSSIYKHVLRTFKKTITKRGRFSLEEDNRLVNLVERLGTDWKEIGKILQRLPVSLKERFEKITAGYSAGLWTQQEEQALTEECHRQLRLIDSGQEVVDEDNEQSDFQDEEEQSRSSVQLNEFCTRDGIKWKIVQKKVKTRSIVQCQLKWNFRLAPSMVERGIWGRGEDRIMLHEMLTSKAQAEFQVDWNNLVLGRPGKACKRRWKIMKKAIPNYQRKPFRFILDALIDQFCPEVRTHADDSDDEEDEDQE